MVLKMKCPKCGFENIDKAKFCMECGHYLIHTFHTTPHVLSFDDKLKKIQRYLPMGLAEKILSQKDRIEGELKQVTVMFCDMVGYTRLSEKLGTEEAYATMDKIYEILIHKVHENEGTVNEMTGDGIMALFGAPIALEDAPQRALHSALSIHREISTFNEQTGISIPVKMRIGIHTGSVVVGTLGNDLRVEFKAVGDTVNLASRMEGLAEPGTTYVTKETFQLTEGLFRFETIGKMIVKGKEGSIPVYKVLSGKKDVYRPRLGSERMIFSEMVGRDNELDKLELQVAKAINGEGSIVNIIGEAGIGKSRLVAELKKRDVMKQVAPYEGRAISIGRNLSFHPIIDLLKQWAPIREDDGEARAFQTLEAAIGRLYPDAVDEVLPFVATLMGMKLPEKYERRVRGIEGEALEKLILKNVRELLIKATERTPLVIVTEDLHWADTSSIEMLESLFRLAKTQRMLFINVFRPGHEETGDRIVETIKESLPGYYVEIVLEPLDTSMSEALIANMLKISGFHHSVIGQIVKRACGNPFFIEEVVRSFIDEKMVVLKDGKFEITEKIQEMIVPYRIIDVLMARIDRLDEETRSLIKVASVIGRNFFYRVIKEVAKTIGDIDSRLLNLKEMQLIRERKRMEEVEYLFKHALAQEVAYESILQKKRRELHRQVAQSIEKIFDERLHEFYGMLAYHYSRAEELDKAEDYLIKAGEEALRSSASSEALNYYQEGLRLYLKKYGDAADPEKLATFEKNIALALYNKGQLENALEYFDRVLQRWGAGSSKNRIIIIFKVTCDFFSVIMNLYLPSKRIKKAPEKRENEVFDLRYKKAVSLVHLDPERCFIEFLSTLNKLGKFDISKIENGIGMWLSGSGLFSWTGISFKLSKKMLDYNKSIVNENDSKEILYYDLFELLYETFVGNWQDVKEYDENLVTLNLRIGEFWHVSTYLLFHGYIHTGRGAFEETQTLINKLSEISKDYENENGIEYWYTLKIVLLIIFKKPQEALKEVEEGISFLMRTGRETVIVYYLGFKAIIQVLLKDFTEANKTLLKTKTLASKQLRLLPIYVSSMLLGQFLYDLHFLEQAIATNDRSDILRFRKQAYQSGQRAIKNAQKYAFDRTEILRLMGLYYWLVGKQKKSVRFWDKSIKEAQRLGARVELARTYMEIGKRFRQEKSKSLILNGVSAAEYLNKASVLFEDMGLLKDVEEIKRIIAYSES